MCKLLSDMEEQVEYMQTMKANFDEDGWADFMRTSKDKPISQFSEFSVSLFARQTAQ